MSKSRMQLSRTKFRKFSILSTKKWGKCFPRKNPVNWGKNLEISRTACPVLRHEWATVHIWHGFRECIARMHWTLGIGWVWRRLSLGQPVLHSLVEFSLLAGPMCGPRFGSNLLTLSPLNSCCKPQIHYVQRSFAFLQRQTQFLCPALLNVHE